MQFPLLLSLAFVVSPEMNVGHGVLGDGNLVDMLALWVSVSFVNRSLPEVGLKRGIQTACRR